MYVIFGARPGKRAVNSLLQDILTCSIILLGGAALACFLARSWWVFDLASHFRPHYLGAAALAAILALALRQRRTLLVIGLLALPHLAAVEPWRGLGSASAKFEARETASSTSLRVMTVNVNWNNQDRAAVMRHIGDVAPDVLFLQEARSRWRREIAALSEVYPYTASAGSRIDTGIHFFSRFPIRASESVRPLGRHYRYLTVDLMIAGKAVRAVSVHAPNPLHRGDRNARNRYLRHLAESVGRTTVPTIVAGDFNVTRWSPFYADFTAESGLTNAAEGQGWVATWPAQLPLGRIAIDHLLVSDHLAVRRFSRGSDVGSDHLPLIAELDLL